MVPKWSKEEKRLLKTITVLKKLGFGLIWCDMISGLLATSSTQVLLNGIPGEYLVIREDSGRATLSRLCFSSSSWIFFHYWFSEHRRRGCYNPWLPGS
jgi:hypothetical protein